jgi:TPR repeat protein
MQAAHGGNSDALNELAFRYSEGIGFTKDTEKAMAYYHSAAEKGNLSAQFNLGINHLGGRYGAEKSPDEAIFWFRKAAEKGHVRSQYWLGHCYLNGNGVTSDSSQAFKWFFKSAESGDMFAQLKVGICYANGTGVNKDEVEAVKWYRLSARQGVSSAQANLGYCYFKGQGVEKDEIEAYAYWNLAGATNSYARENLSVVEKTMTPEARLLAQQRTKKLKKEIEGKLETIEDLKDAIQNERRIKGA